MKINFYKTIILVISISLVSGCNFDKRPTYEERQITDEAEAICVDYDLDCKIEISVALKEDGITIYDLDIDSNGYEEKTQNEKVSIINKIEDISIPGSVGFVVGIHSQGNDYRYDEDEGLTVFKKGEPIVQQSSSTNSVNSSETLLGTWLDTGVFERVIKIKKMEDKYTMTSEYSDGSSETITLGVDIVNGETRLYETRNAYGDYMIIETDGSLAFYDNRGLIYSIEP